MTESGQAEACKPTPEENQDDDEDFEMEHSDEEMRMKDGKEWEPSPEEIAELFERIEKEKVLELDWTTPGRRPPTPAVKHDSQKEVDDVAEGKQEEKSDFDFQDEMTSMKLSSKAIRPAGSDAGPRGSAKKKTTSLDAILSNMARHRKLDMMEDDDEDPLP
uniref:PAXIP1-associated glutamate-rich protein 1 n=1 Tax=Homalodisca liturata TaxID=320908 RepID=A0A1B6JE64_9HEMI